MDNHNERLETLTAAFAALGAPDPAGWARSEAQEDIPQLARFCFLRSVWPKLIDTWTRDVGWVERLSDSDTEPFADASVGLSRMRDAGVEPIDVGRVARWVAYETVFGLLYHLGCGIDDDAGDAAPGWQLMETAGFDGALTGRSIAGLYEDLLGLDPSGLEGRSGPSG